VGDRPALDCDPVGTRRLARQFVLALGASHGHRRASHACALSVCAIATAAYSHRLISHGVEGLVITSLSAAMAGSVYACDRSGPELGISSGDTSSDSGS